MAMEDVDRAYREIKREIEEHEKKKTGWFSRPKAQLPERPVELQIPESLKKYVADQILDFDTSIARIEEKLSKIAELHEKRDTFIESKRKFEHDKSFAELLDIANPEKVEAVAYIPEQKILIPAQGGLETYHQVMTLIGADPGQIVFIKKRGD